MSTPTPTVPIARHAGEGEALWFLGSLVTIKASGEDTGGRMAVIEHLSPRSSGSPLHVHRNEDESFYVLEGELTMWVDGQTIAAPGGFDDFVRTIGEPAQQLVIPPPATEPPDIAALSAIAARHGIEILGPPGIPD